MVKLLAEQVASALVQAIESSRGITDEDAIKKFSVLMGNLHFHDGSQSPIAWNDVQAILYWNKYVLRNSGKLLEVPVTATEGYNQHHHTSEFDGGKIAGIMGVHDHRDNNHGGFAFAVFHPATDVPQAKWEQ